MMVFLRYMLFLDFSNPLEANYANKAGVDFSHELKLILYSCVWMSYQYIECVHSMV